MTTTERSTYAAGLRAVADLIDAHPDLPIPYRLDRVGLMWFVHDDIETVLTIRALMTDPVTRPYDSIRDNFPVEVTGTLAGFAVLILIAREIALDPREGFMVQRPAMNPRLFVAEQVLA